MGERDSQAAAERTVGCPFCDIIDGRDTSVEIIERAAEWLAFFPDTPATRGHTLVVPTQHVQHFWALDERTASVLTGASIRLGCAIEQALQPQGMNLITSRGGAAEQTIPHVHLHVVPRWESDALDEIWPPRREMDLAVMRDVAQRVRSALLAI